MLKFIENYQEILVVIAVIFIILVGGIAAALGVRQGHEWAFAGFAGHHHTIREMFAILLGRSL